MTDLRESERTQGPESDDHGAGRTTAPPKIGLVGCVAAKHSQPAPARELYVSELFRRRRAYVEALCDSWAIVSARWGLVMPDDVIAPYDWTLTDWNARERFCWAGRVARIVRETWPGAQLVLLAGGLYARELVPRLPGVITPCQGLAIGQQLRLLAQAVDQQRAQQQLGLFTKED